MAKLDVPTLSKRAKAPKMSVSQTASMRPRRGGADWPHTASRRTHARPRLEAATLRVRAVTKVRAYVARLMHRVAAGEAPAAIGTARGSSTATAGERIEVARRACCRTRARRAASREGARRAVERCWADETDSEAEAVPLGCETSDLDALRIARNRLAADVERLRTLAREGDATAARRASSEALVWQSPAMVPSDPWVRDPLHAYTPAARREIACAGALSINDVDDASEADDERDPYHPPFLTYIWEAASSRSLPTAFWRGTGAGNTEEVLGAP